MIGGTIPLTMFLGLVARIPSEVNDIIDVDVRESSHDSS